MALGLSPAVAIKDCCGSASVDVGDAVAVPEDFVAGGDGGLCGETEQQAQQDTTVLQAGADVAGCREDPGFRHLRYS